MLSVEEQLSRYGDWVALQQPDEALALPASAPPPRRRWLPAAACVAVVAVVAAVVWWPRNGEDSGITTEVPSTTVVESTPTMTTEPPVATTTRNASPSPNAPKQDNGYAQVWTGNELIITGGFTQGLGGGTPTLRGAAFNPRTSAWRPIADAPRPRNHGFAVWTGEEVIVGGGQDSSTVDAYNPATDTWRSLPDPPVSLTQSFEASGQPIMVGEQVAIYAWQLGHGVLLDPRSGSWTRLPTVALPLPDSEGRRFHLSSQLHWTGTELYALIGREATYFDGERNPRKPQLEGAVFNLRAGTVRLMPILNASHSFVIGQEFYAWSTFLEGRSLVAFSSYDRESVAKRFDPTTFRWQEAAAPPMTGCAGGTRATVVPRGVLAANSCSRVSYLYDFDAGRWNELDPAVNVDYFWTGEGFIGWSGDGGRRLDPIVLRDERLLRADASLTVAPPIARPADWRWADSVWTGRELFTIEVSRAQPAPVARLYNPQTSTWRLAGTTPHSYYSPFVVWTGREMVVGGGDSVRVDAYDPATDRWRRLPDAPTSIVDKPGSVAATMAGSRVAVWSATNGTGALFDPSTEQWTRLPETGGSGDEFLDVQLHGTDRELVVVYGRKPANRDANPSLGWISIDLVGTEVRRDGVSIGPMQPDQTWLPLSARATFVDAGRLVVFGVRADGATDGGRAVDLVSRGQGPFRSPVALVPSPPLRECSALPRALRSGSLVLAVSPCDPDAYLWDSSSSTWTRAAGLFFAPSAHAHFIGASVITWRGGTDVTVAHNK